MREASFDRVGAVFAPSVDTLFVLCFIVDLGVNLCTAFRDDHGDLVLDGAACMRRYVCSVWFACDLVSILPLEARDVV